MPKTFEGQVAIVTGGNSGIGLSTVHGFLEQGAQVAIFDIAESPSEHLPQLQTAAAAAARTIKYFQCDVSSSDSVDKAVKAVADAFGHIDILVNCAGISDSFERASDTTNASWDKVISINLNGPFYTTRAVIPYFTKNHRQADPGAAPAYDLAGKQYPAPTPSKGVIVNICSVAALGGGSAGAAYTASKHGLLGLSRSTSWMYRHDGIRCNVVFPGPVITNIQANSKMKIDPTGIAVLTPYHNLASGPAIDPRSIANAVLWLADPSNLNVNGAEITVDSGWTSA